MRWWETLERWQGWQARAQAQQSFCMASHMKHQETSLADALISEWLRECRELNI
jgi:hypothetical protein